MHGPSAEGCMYIGSVGRLI